MKLSELVKFPEKLKHWEVCLSLVPTEHPDDEKNLCDCGVEQYNAGRNDLANMDVEVDEEAIAKEIALFYGVSDFESLKAHARIYGHDGDCVNEPQPCANCQYDEFTKLAQAITDAGYVKMSEIKIDEHKLFDFIYDWYVNDKGSSGRTINMMELSQAISQNITSLIRGRNK
jgi:hypothetical protein